MRPDPFYRSRTALLAALLACAFVGTAAAGGKQEPPKTPEPHAPSAEASSAAGAAALAGAAAVNSTNVGVGVGVKASQDLDVTNVNLQQQGLHADLSNRNANLGLNVQGQDQAQDQSQKQEQDQMQTAIADQAQVQSANNEGNHQSITINEAAPPSRVTVRSAPNVFAADAYPSAPCRVSGSAGGSWLGGGISFGGSKLDPECDKRETARSFALLGQYEAALRILCSTRAARDALGPDCLNYPAPGPVSPVQAPAAPPSIDTSAFVTRDELAERDRRLTKALAEK